MASSIRRCHRPRCASLSPKTTIETPVPDSGGGWTSRALRFLRPARRVEPLTRNGAPPLYGAGSPRCRLRPFLGPDETVQAARYPNVKTVRLMVGPVKPTRNPRRHKATCARPRRRNADHWPVLALRPPPAGQLPRTSRWLFKMYEEEAEMGFPGAACAPMVREPLGRLSRRIARGSDGH